jgi:hypothetical protein
MLILVELLITTFYVDIGGIVDYHFLCWYWWNSWSPLSMLILVELLITTFYADIDGIVDHHFLLLILVELLITTFCWYWWNSWSLLSMLSGDQQLHQYQHRKWWSAIPSISA